MDNKFVIISVGCNAEPYLDEWYDSIITQKYENWECIIQLDISTDDSESKLRTLIENDDRFKLEVNIERKYCLKNTYECVQRANDDESIMVCVDLDDKFPNTNVLNILDSKYTKDVWMTYGSYIDNYNNHGYWCREINSNVWKTNSHRKNVWCATHLKTFKKWIFDKIKDEDFKMDDGSWIQRATDRSFMYPMLEMSGKERAIFISDVMYFYRIYGQQKPMNDIEEKCVACINNKQPYKKLENKNDTSNDNV